MAAFHGALGIVVRLLEGMDINETDKNGLTALHHACQQGHVDIVRFLLQKGALHDVYTKEGNSVLHEAAYSGNVEIVDMLLRKGFPSVDMRNNENWTAAHEAAKEGHIGVLEKLVERGADLEACVKDGSSSLILAAFHGRFEMVKWLLEKGAQVNAVDEEGCPALHSVLLGADISVPIISHLLSHGADIHARTKSGRSVLDFAVIKGETKIVELLFQTTNVDVNARDEQGTTALHVAASCNRSNIMEILINQKADLSACRNGGWTALHDAASNGAIDAVEVLLAHGAEVDVKDTNGTTALFKAAHRGKQDVVRRLIAHKADVNASSIHQWLPLHAAARSGDVETIKLLVQHGANVHGLTENGSNVLHLAAHSGSNKAVKYLVHHVQDVNAVDQGGLTALHSAVQYCDIDTVKFLVENGANIHAVANNSKSVMFVAAQYGRRAIVEYLQTKGLGVNETNENGQTPLHVAAQIGDLDAVEMLVEKGADLHALMKSRASALHVAAAKGNANIIDYLIQKGLDVNAVDEGGWSPLHAAAGTGRVNAVELLAKNRANIHAKVKAGATALYVAAEHGHKEVVAFLLSKRNVDVNEMTESNGRAPIHAAASSGSVDVLKLLVEHGADIHACTSHDKTALHLAISFGKREAVEYLVQQGVDVNAVDERGQTALHCLRYAWGSNCAPVLLGADNVHESINLPDQDGFCPLHLVAAAHCADEARELLKNGADVAILTTAGRSPLELAVFSPFRCSALSTICELVRFGAEWTDTCQAILDKAASEIEPGESPDDESTQHLQWWRGLRACILQWERQLRDGSTKLFSVPIEVVQRGDASVKTFFVNAASSSPDDVVYRSKVCVVGPSNWGKTSLVRSLEAVKTQLTSAADRTIGIELVSNYLSDPNTQAPHHQVTFWDFAGQDVYQVAHALFFSPRTLYVLVVDVDAYKQQLDHVETLPLEKVDGTMDRFLSRHIFRWVRTIFAQQSDAEFLVLGTKADLLENQQIAAIRRDLKERIIRWKEAFKRELEQEHSATETAVGGSPAHGQGNDRRCDIRELKEKLNRLASEQWLVVDIMRQDSIREVRRKLQQHIEAYRPGFPMHGNYARVLKAVIAKRDNAKGNGDGKLRILDSVMQFETFCVELMDEIEGLTEDECREILRTLHDLGDLLWYDHIDLGRLRDCIILDPTLVIDVVREVISHNHVRATSSVSNNQDDDMPCINGFLKHERFETFSLWKDMDKEMKGEFKLLLKHFRLAYPAHDGIMLPESDVIVPSLWKLHASAKSDPLLTPFPQAQSHTAWLSHYCWEYEISADLSDMIFEQFAVQSFSSYVTREVRANCIESNCDDFQSRVTLHPSTTSHDIIRIEFAGENADVTWSNMRWNLIKLEKVLGEYCFLKIRRYVVDQDKRYDLQVAIKAWNDSIVRTGNPDDAQTNCAWTPPDLEWYILRVWKDSSTVVQYQQVLMQKLQGKMLEALTNLVVTGESSRRFPVLWSLEYRDEKSIAVLRMFSDLSGKCYHAPIELEVLPEFLAKHGTKIKAGVTLLTNIPSSALPVPMLTAALKGLAPSVDGKVNHAIKIHDALERLDMTDTPGGVTKASINSNLSPNGTMAVLRDLLLLHDDSFDELSVTEVCNLQCAATEDGKFVWAHESEIRILKNHLKSCQPRPIAPPTAPPAASPSASLTTSPTASPSNTKSLTAASGLCLRLCIERVEGLRTWDWLKTYCTWELYYANSKTPLAEGATTKNVNRKVIPSWDSPSPPLDAVDSVEILQECRIVVHVKRRSRFWWTKFIGKGEVVLRPLISDDATHNFHCEPIQVTLDTTDYPSTITVHCQITSGN